MKQFPLAVVSLVLAMQCIGAQPRIEEVGYKSHGTTLAGSIVLPPGEIRAAVIFVHGSRKTLAQPGLGAAIRGCRHRGARL